MEIKNQIIKEYSIKIEDIIKNKDSTDGNVYIILTKKLKYIAKFYDNKEHTLSMIKVHNYLINNGMNVPKIIKNKYDNYYTLLDNNKYCVVYSFLDGKGLGKKFNDINTQISINIAREIKKLHKITKDNNEYNLDSIPFNIEKDFSRYSLLHFDLTKFNIFYNNKWKSKIGFIDFDDAKYGPTIIDVAITISLLYFSKSKGINIAGLNAFLNEYYDNKNLKQEELPYLKTCAIKWIEYIINNNNFDSSTKESFEIRKNLIESFKF